jgi:hypothetical protein
MSERRTSKRIVERVQAERAEEERWTKVVCTACKEIAARKQPTDQMVIALAWVTEAWPKVMKWDGCTVRPTAIARDLTALARGTDAGRFSEWFVCYAWKGFRAWAREMAKDPFQAWRERGEAVFAASLLGIDLKRRYAELEDKEQREGKAYELEAGGD